MAVSWVQLLSRFGLTMVFFTASMLTFGWELENILELKQDLEDRKCVLTCIPSKASLADHVELMKSIIIIIHYGILVPFSLNIVHSLLYACTYTEEPRAVVVAQARPPVLAVKYSSKDKICDLMLYIFIFIIGVTFCMTVMSFCLKRLLVVYLSADMAQNECLSVMQDYDRIRYIIAYLIIFSTLLVLWPFSPFFLKGRKLIIKKFFNIVGETAVPLQSNIMVLQPKEKRIPLRAFLNNSKNVSGNVPGKVLAAPNAQSTTRLETARVENVAPSTSGTMSMRQERLVTDIGPLTRRSDTRSNAAVMHHEQTNRDSNISDISQYSSIAPLEFDV